MDTVRKELKARASPTSDIDLGGFRVITTFDRRRSGRPCARCARSGRTRTPEGRAHRSVRRASPAPARSSRCTAGRPRASSTRRPRRRVQPGSTFKPFALAGALAGRHRAASSRFDGNSPFQLPGTDKEVNNEFDQRLRLDRRPGQGDRAVHQHGVRRPGGRRWGRRRSSRRLSPPASPRTRRGWTPTRSTPSGTASVHNIDMASAYARSRRRAAAGMVHRATR